LRPGSRPLPTSALPRRREAPGQSPMVSANLSRSVQLWRHRRSGEEPQPATASRVWASLGWFRAADGLHAAGSRPSAHAIPSFEAGRRSGLRPVMQIPSRFGRRSPVVTPMVSQAWPLAADCGLFCGSSAPAEGSRMPRPPVFEVRVETVLRCPSDHRHRSELRGSENSQPPRHMGINRAPFLGISLAEHESLQLPDTPVLKLSLHPTSNLHELAPRKLLHHGWRSHSRRAGDPSPEHHQPYSLSQPQRIPVAWFGARASPTGTHSRPR